MDLYRTVDALGYADLWSSIRQDLRYFFSRGWPLIWGCVEGYELRFSRCGTFFIVFYSYRKEGEQYSGEWRKTISFMPSAFSRQEEQVAKIVDRLPRGSRIRIRVDHKQPSRSIAEL